MSFAVAASCAAVFAVRSASSATERSSASGSPAGEGYRDKKFLS